MPNVSVIVCNLNGMRFLPRLLATLRAQRGVGVEIIVADRESRDGSREHLAGCPDVTVITEPPGSGMVAGYHAAVAAASHDLLFFCNEDLWLDADCLARLARHISIADRVGAADPWQWSYDGTRLIHAGTRFASAGFDPISCYPPRRFDFLVPLADGETVPFGSSGAVLMHRRMYAEIGGWDTSFFLEFDDVELFLRAWQLGWRCVAAPDAKVYHAVGMSTFQAGPPPGQVRSRRHVAGASNRAVLPQILHRGVAPVGRGAPARAPRQLPAAPPSRAGQDARRGGAVDARPTPGGAALPPGEPAAQPPATGAEILHRGRVPARRAMTVSSCAA